nr:SDR family oxidoreductase [Sphingobium estronivorans]
MQEQEADTMATLTGNGVHGRLAGRMALITGGLRGIGLACAKRFAAEGATLLLSDLDPLDAPAVRAALAELDGAADYIRADVTSEQDWLSIRAALDEGSGKLHILVNNAGIDQTGAIDSISLDLWHHVMDINATGPFLAARTLLPQLARGGADVRGGASVINISSIMGIVGHAEASAYNASKGALRLFTKGIAMEWAQAGMAIRANSIHPGCIFTALLESGFQNWVERGYAASVDDLVEAMAAKTPMGRLGRPEDVAAAAAFLASDDSAYMTGTELVIDGGWTAQ